MSFFDIFPTFHEAPYSYIVVPIILVCSIVGFYNKAFFHKHLLHPYEVWRGKRWYTLLTSALIHRGWLHLGNNLLIIYGLGFDMFGNIEQEYGVLPAYFITPLLFFLLTIIPNIIQTTVKRNDFVFTAVGASGLSFGLYGFSALFFPLEKMNSKIIPFINNAFQTWLLFLLILILFTQVKRSKLINTHLHLSSYLVGSVAALIIRPGAITDLLRAF